MISIAKHMDEYDIAQEVRLERKLHKGSFLLVEGTTDIKRFRVFIDDDGCSLVNVMEEKTLSRPSNYFMRMASLAFSGLSMRILAV